MGIIARISSDVDENAGVTRVFIITELDISTRASLNRVAARASAHASVSQRALVAAAYEELGIDLVWAEGPVKMSPEERFPAAKEIEYKNVPVEKPGPLEDIVPKRLRDDLRFRKWMGGEVLHMWEIPFDLGDY